MSGTVESQDPSHRKAAWMRGLHMLVVLLLINLASTVLAVVALIQFFWMLFNEEKKRRDRTIWARFSALA